MLQVSERPGRAGNDITCPCCGGLALELFEDTLDIDNNIVGIQICIICSAIVNRSSLERVISVPDELRDKQTAQLNKVYAIGHHFGETLEHEVEAHRHTLDFFIDKAIKKTNPEKLVSAEIGIGRGTLLRAAAPLFKRCYGIDLAYTLLETTTDYMPVPNNVVLLDAITNVPEPVDVVFAWHSFEHVPRLHDLIAAVRSVLKAGGYLFFQVPLYRPNHIVESHYTFLNRRAVAVLAELELFEVVDMWTDHPRACLTCLLRKPPE
jgi:2-polyprenyl-3-methyl-5-hydroxy-6-metoxy-1,4-benzoquinol methylase